MRRTLWKYVDLQKALYGLKQSGLRWNDLLVTKLTTKHGMEQCMADPCIFRKIEKGVIVLILAYVDDMAVAGLKIEVDKFTLNEDFTTVDLGILSFFTGCAVIQDVENGVTRINQKTFIETFAKRFDVTTTARYPASADANLGARMDGEPGITWPYKEAVGALMWLVVWSRLEVANAARAVARHTNNPTERYKQAVLQNHQASARDEGSVSHVQTGIGFGSVGVHGFTTQRRPTTGGWYPG